MKDLLLTALPTFRRPFLRLSGAVVLALVLLLGSSAAPAAAQDDTITITGRGWGHGRGMGQYGAYGYANDHGWTSAQILDHYYGNTVAGSVPADAPVDPAQVRVDLRFMRGRTTTVAIGDGSIQLRGTDEADLGLIGTGAVRLRSTSGGFEVETATTCAGPWAAHSFISGRTTVRLLGASSATGPDGHLQACGSSYRGWYLGELRAVVHDGFPLTINVVSIEEYLRGVVPNEVPALWPSPALEAQVVAARSYALAGDTRQQPYADTCDTARCQVYDGVFTERGGNLRSSTHERTDAAVAATAGLVRLTSSGSIARTEFSSSTGGHTVAGDFPAVVDLGDSIAANPNHVWTRTISKSAIENRYGLGSLVSAEVVERNGLGSDGGRATKVRFTFRRGVVTETGNRVRSILGLKSDWFSFGVGSGAELRSTTEGRYVDWAYQQLGGRAATTSELVYWVGAVGAGNRLSLAEQLAHDDYFAGQLLDELYLTALERSSDRLGRSYWLDRIEDGATLGTIGSSFYGSGEYYERSGGTAAGFVSALYADILGRDPDDAGKRYWVERVEQDRVPIHHIAAGFYDSLESRRTRARQLYQRLIGQEPTGQLTTTLADRLLRLDDLDLAAEIASDAEVASS